MTQEEKQLLLIKDLGARLAYGVIVHSLGMPHEQMLIGYIPDIEYYNIKPYLRPMSSMTEEERNEATQFEINNLGPIGCNWNLLVSNSSQLVDWLNEKMFDYRGLIEEGLALKAPEGMYKID